MLDALPSGESAVGREFHVNESVICTKYGAFKQKHTSSGYCVNLWMSVARGWRAFLPRARLTCVRGRSRTRPLGAPTVKLGVTRPCGLESVR